MPNTNTDHLTTLILGLTKSEKKNFRLQTKKAGRAVLLYEKLYNHILHYKQYDELLVLKRIPEIKKSQLANIKANLYKAVLRSLRDLNKENYLEIKAREQFDFAKILYTKGQYRASLEILQKVKELAARIYNQPLEYLALSFEKKIESQHITGSMSTKAIQLERDSVSKIEDIALQDQLSNLSLLMYGKYIKLGIPRSMEEIEELQEFFFEKIPNTPVEEMGFYQKLYLYQSYVWYYRMIQDFANCYRYAQRWVELFETESKMKHFDTVTYIKGLHCLLHPLYLSGKVERFEHYLSKLNEIDRNESYTLSINERSQLHLFQHIHSIELIIMRVDYESGVKKLHPIEELVESGQLDLNRNLSLRYMLACIYFGANKYDEALTHLNILTNQKYIHFKEDIQCFGRILKLIAHYDKGDYELIIYDVRSVYRFLLKMQELQAPQKEILRFIRKTSSISPDQLMEEFSLLRDKLLPLESDPIHKRAFIYLDIISWLDSKINKVSMAEAIRARKKKGSTQQ